MSNIVVPQEDYLVSQSNELIDARYPTPLTLNEKKIVLMMISLIQPSDEDFKTYTVSVKDYVRLLGLDENTEPHGYLRKLMRKLMERVLEIPKADGGWALMHWVSNCELVRKKSELSFTFDPKLKPYLLQLKTFTQYRLANVLELSSVYSISIYELLKKWENVAQKNKNKEKIFNIEDFRLSIGANKPTYKRYFEFKVKILEPALNEINEKTDISYTFEPIKSGHKVTHLVFKIKEDKRQKKNQNKPQKKTANSKDWGVLAGKLKVLNLHFELDENILEGLYQQGMEIWKQDHDIPQRFETELIALCSYVKTQTSINNPVGYIRAQFKEALTQENPTFTTLVRTEAIPDWYENKEDNQETKPEEQTEGKSPDLDFAYISELIRKKLDNTLTKEEEVYLDSLVLK